MLFRVEVVVGLKEGMLDAEGETVKRSLRSLGIDLVDVKTSKVYELTVDCSDREKTIEVAEESCRKLLANPVVNRYHIVVENE